MERNTVMNYGIPRVPGFWRIFIEKLSLGGKTLLGYTDSGNAAS
jgi:hypothetical protein